jgi:hypothetical protein
MSLQSSKSQKIVNFPSFEVHPVRKTINIIVLMNNVFVTHMAKRVYIKDSTKHGRKVQ